MFTPRNSEELDPAVRDEFEGAAAESMARFLKEHQFDGSHLFPAGDIVPVGGMIMWPGATVPNSKWLWCRGQQVSRTTYLALFNIFGTTYGAGDGTTTFNLPDLQQRFPLGKAAAGTGSTLGADGGAIDHTHAGGAHTHSIASESDHTHTVAAHAHSIASQAAHAHTIPDNAETVSLTNAAQGADFQVATGDHDHGGSTGTAGSHDHGGGTGNASPSTDAQGGHDHGGVTGGASGATGDANPPYLVVNFLIFSGVEVN